MDDLKEYKLFAKNLAEISGKIIKAISGQIFR